MQMAKTAGALARHGDAQGRRAEQEIGDRRQGRAAVLRPLAGVGGREALDGPATLHRYDGAEDAVELGL